MMKDKDEKRKRTIEKYKNYLIKYWKAFKNMLNSKNTFIYGISYIT